MTTKTKRTRWTIDSYSEHVWNMYHHTIYVIPGQTWKGVDHKHWHYCVEHGAYYARPHSVCTESIGSQCCECRRQLTLKSNYKITQAFVGQTTPDGHVILEHVGYQPTPSDLKKGWKGKALYRYKCAQCGNTEAVAASTHLKVVGNTSGCIECASKRETIERHRRNKAKAIEPCQFYLASVYYDDYLKLGISKDYERRAAAGNQGNPYFDKNLTPEEHYYSDNVDLSYEHCWFLSDWHPRCIIFSIEQILLKATASYRPKEALPKEIIETLWCGQSELRDWHLEPNDVINAFHYLLEKFLTAGLDNWYETYCEEFAKADQLIITGGS